MFYVNKTKLTLNLENISRDFVVFEAKKGEGNYRKSLIPDVAVQECRALSVLYRGGSICYMLYRRSDADRNDLTGKLEDYEDTLRIREIDVQEKGIGETVLAQLLFNAIPSLGSDGSMYHNLTGVLYYMDSAWMKEDGFYALEVSMTWEYCIKMMVKSFRRVKDKKIPTTEPRYLMDAESGMLRRVLKNDSDRKAVQYERRSSYTNHKNNVTFLNFDTLDKFHQCKSGILYRFLHDVEELLAEYLTVELTTIQEYTEQGRHRSPECMDQMKELLKERTVFLENTTEDKILAEVLVDALKRHYQIEVQYGTPGAGDVLLRIVHEKEYYENDPKQDPYGKTPKNCVVQHLTVENFSADDRKGERENLCLRKVIQELGVKLDLLEERLQFYNWVALGYEKPTAFVVKYQQGKSNSPIFFDRLTIDTDGTLTFDSWENGQASETRSDERLKIRKAFEKTDGAKTSIDTQIEGLIYEDIDHIQIIRNTDMIPLPDMEEVYRRLRATVDKERLPLAPLCDIVRDVLRNTTVKNTTKQQELLVWLGTQGKTAHRWEIKERIGLKSKLDKQIIQAYHDQTKHWIRCPMRDKDSKERMFRGILDIHSFKHDGREYYCSGYFQDGIQVKMERACQIREVSAVNGVPQIERYLPLMAVDFVRASAWTVVPFPFKYLREWRAQQNMMIKSKQSRELK